MSLWWSGFRGAASLTLCPMDSGPSTSPGRAALHAARPRSPWTAGRRPRGRHRSLRPRNASCRRSAAAAAGGRNDRVGSLLALEVGAGRVSRAGNLFLDHRGGILFGLVVGLQRLAGVRVLLGLVV